MTSMANNQIYFYIFFVLFSGFAYSSSAYVLIVGGNDGWVPKPSENYTHWAERLRFNVNDTLLFIYKKGSDSVLVVNKDNYEKCNIENPIMLMDNGNSIFLLKRSGQFYFISGNKTSCNEGQKVAILVLAVRNHHARPSPSDPSPSSSDGDDDDAPAPVEDPDSDAPADHNTAGKPPRRSFATAAFTCLVVLVVTVSLVLSDFIVSY